MIKHLKALMRYRRWRKAVKKLDNAAIPMGMYQFIYGEHHPDLKRNNKKWMRLMRLRQNYQIKNAM